MAEDDDPLIGYGEMARLAGVKSGTLHAYRSQGRLPPPDDDSVPDRPRWRLSTFEAWMASRPGPGARTDLHGSGGGNAL
ncbi:MarR family transcriptional regulator [Frankia sp. CcI49]|uniref:MarR family transcriptional regulator n=1 Tax=Frankia sp. CcI49 TaxID=1745382 RepID=UPI0009782C89|nr:MarR family transcriptional regulator [Frankia sp. CcI49]ONH61298.1 MarR family transcriptional regulator [Frankia sp. CcI49]